MTYKGRTAQSRKLDIDAAPTPTPTKKNHLHFMTWPQQSTPTMVATPTSSVPSLVKTLLEKDTLDEVSFPV